MRFPLRHRSSAGLITSLVIAVLIAGCSGSKDEDQVATTEEPKPPVNQGDVDKPNDAVKQATSVEPVKLAPREPYVAGSSPETERMGEDWPQFLGLNADSVSQETGLLKEWPEEGPPVLWKMRIGSGYAAPSIMGNKLLLYHRQGNEDALECYTADTGEWIWRETFPTEFIDPYGYSNGPRCSPLVTEEYVYTFSSDGRLTCYQLEDGKVLWTKETSQEFDVPIGFFGVGSTPVLEGNLLIVMVGGHPNAGVVAFDARSGDVVWKSVDLDAWDMKGKPGQNDPKLASYASLVVREIHGERHLLAFMRPGLVSLNPQSGEINFSYYLRSRLHDSVNAAMPLVVNNQIFLTAAYNVGAVLLQVAEDGKSVSEIWRDKEVMQAHWTTPIYHDGYLYGFSGRHEVPSSMRCVEWATGNLQWMTPEEDDESDFVSPRDGASGVEPKWYGRGSAVMAEDKFIVLGERGALAMVPVDPSKFSELVRVKYPEMKYPSWTGPVLSRGRLYIRCEDKYPNRGEYYLLCLDLKAGEQ